MNEGEGELKTLIKKLVTIDVVHGKEVFGCLVLRQQIFDILEEAKNQKPRLDKYANQTAPNPFIDYTRYMVDDLNWFKRYFGE